MVIITPSERQVIEVCPSKQWLMEIEEELERIRKVTA